MRVYEEYESAAEKRRAQRSGVRRRRASGKARGYLLLFEENGQQWDGHTSVWSDALGETFCLVPGEGPRAVTAVTPSQDYLAANCRLISWESMPADWRAAFADNLRQNLEYLEGAELAAFKRKYRRVLSPGKSVALRR